MSEFLSSTPEPDVTLSGRELARIVRSCAYLYRDVDFGNPTSAAYLLALSTWLADLEKLPFSPVSKAKSPRRERAAVDDVFLRELDIEGVRRFLRDEHSSKKDLVRLAGVRLSIPHSRLQKLKQVEIKERIEAALHNEESLTIISQEAKRGGEQRSS